MQILMAGIEAVSKRTTIKIQILIAGIEAVSKNKAILSQSTTYFILMSNTQAIYKAKKNLICYLNKQSKKYFVNNISWSN